MGRSTKRDHEAIALLVADVFEAAGALRRYGERLAGQAGQTQARWQLLSVVSVGEWTVPMAADRLGTSRQAVQRIANELVDEGLAAFEENPRHRRSPFLRLTDAGARVLAVITEGAASSNESLAARLGSLDVTGVRSALQHLTATVRAEIQEAAGSPAR